MKRKISQKERELLRKTVAMRDAIFNFYDTDDKLTEDGFIGRNKFSEANESLILLLDDTIIKLKLMIFNQENPKDLI